MIREIDHRALNKREDMKKKLQPIVHREDGTILCYPDADEANADWLRARRLLVEGRTEELQEKLDTPMWVEEE